VGVLCYVETVVEINISGGHWCGIIFYDSVLLTLVWLYYVVTIISVRAFVWITW